MTQRQFVAYTEDNFYGIRMEKVLGKHSDVDTLMHQEAVVTYPHPTLVRIREEYDEELTRRYDAEFKKIVAAY